MSQAYHGVTAGQHQANFNSLSAQGYRMISLSVYGNVRAGSKCRHISISEQNGHDGKMILRSMAIYGSPSDRLFIGVWHPNPGYTKWHVHYADDGANYQTVFNAETSNPFYRPTDVAVSSDHLYCSLFKDDMVGPWVARHGMTSAQYESEFDAQNARGFYPISMQGGGSGGDTRYAAISSVVSRVVV